MRMGWLFAALTLSVFPLPLAAATPSFEQFKLANGLEVIVIPNHRVPAVTQMLWLRVGAADDPSGKSGLAHFHEHMMYQGTPVYPAGSYADMITAAGGEQNAFTGSDATAYFITIAKERLPLAMELEANRMGALAPSNENATKEKEVIIEERRARIENNPKALFGEQINAALWRNHPYHQPIIGWMHEMQGLTKSDVLAFHQRWYHPNNAVLILSGDITAAEARPLVERYYAGLAASTTPKRHWTTEPPQIAERGVVMHHPNVQQPVWARLYSASSLGAGEKKHALPLLVLSQLLGGGKTSTLYRSLVVDKRIASGVDVAYDVFRIGPAEFEISVTPEPDSEMSVVEKAVDEELARAIKDGFSEKEIARAKTILKAQSIYARDGLESMARVMGWIRMIGLDKNYFLRWPEMIEAVTLAQITEAARATLVARQSVTGVLLPEEKKKDK
jgi:zinc protease